MRIFECQNCSQALYFENSNCVSCGLRLGYLPEQATMTALREDNGTWQALAEPEGRYRYCGNAIHDVCNWLVPADQPEPVLSGLPAQPDHPGPLGAGKSRRTGARSRSAKHRLFYTLLRFRLPLATKAEEPDGLAFDFIADHTGPPATSRS